MDKQLEKNIDNLTTLIDNLKITLSCTFVFHYWLDHVNKERRVHFKNGFLVDNYTNKNLLKELLHWNTVCIKHPDISNDKELHKKIGSFGALIFIENRIAYVSDTSYRVTIKKKLDLFKQLFFVLDLIASKEELETI